MSEGVRQMGNQPYRECIGVFTHWTEAGAAAKGARNRGRLARVFVRGVRAGGANGVVWMVVDFGPRKARSPSVT